MRLRSALSTQMALMSLKMTRKSEAELVRTRWGHPQLMSIPEQKLSQVRYTVRNWVQLAGRGATWGERGDERLREPYKLPNEGRVGKTVGYNRVRPEKPIGEGKTYPIIC